MPLKVECIGTMSGVDTMRISGFMDGELSELKNMEHTESVEKLMYMLDARNGALGRRWVRGYGVRSVWYDDEYAYVNIWNSCD